MELITRSPKVTLHDHLDGGLRPATVLELASEIGHTLPAGDAESLGQWFGEAAHSGSLVRYLETFEHTVAVMQTAEHLQRVAREFVADMVADGVVYAETRWAPQQHLTQGLSLQQAVDAVQAGLDEGMAAARAAGRSIQANQLLSAMRHTGTGDEIAELMLRNRDRGIAGYDIAGPEDGFPPTRQLSAFQRLRRENAQITIHAGEAYGLPSIHEAVQVCGTHRVGHGTRIIDDVAVADDGTVSLGRLAAYVRDQQVPLEMCPSSNVQTGAAASIAEHPFGRLAALGFAVTVNCDNRLMSQTTLSREFALLSEAFDYGLTDLRRFTLTAARAAFWPHDHRERLIAEVIEPGYAALID